MILTENVSVGYDSSESDKNFFIIFPVSNSLMYFWYWNMHYLMFLFKTNYLRTA